MRMPMRFFPVCSRKGVRMTAESTAERSGRAHPAEPHCWELTSPVDFFFEETKMWASLRHVVRSKGSAFELGFIGDRCILSSPVVGFLL